MIRRSLRIRENGAAVDGLQVELRARYKVMKRSFRQEGIAISQGGRGVFKVVVVVGLELVALVLAHARVK